MTDRKFKYAAVFLAIVVLASFGSGLESETPQPQKHTILLELTPESAPVLQLFRAEFVDSFERTSLSPWTTLGTSPWGIRDTMDTYGPNTVAASGYQYAGIPGTDIALYPGNETDSLITPTIDLTGWDSLFFSFSYWADFESNATNFDGGIIQISSNNGATWVQIDSLAQGHLNPTYDDTLCGTGQIGTPWAYCHDRHYWVAVSSMDLMGLGYVSSGNQMKIRFVFDSDDQSSGQGWFIDDVRIADTSPPDLQAPIITHTPLTDTTDTLNNYTITATVTDEGAGVDPDSVLLHYEIESGPILDVTMTNLGGNTYEADIPVQTFHTDIWYQILAADSAGNWGETPLYNFEVTNARTISYDDGQPWFAPDTLADGYFTRFRFTDVGIDSGQIHQLKVMFEGPGEVDVRVYQATATTPGPFLDSIAGIISPGYDWYTVDLDPLNIQTANPYGIVVGYYKIPPPEVGILRDQIMNYPEIMWNITGTTWSPSTGGDFIMRLKVIPLDEPGIEENAGSVLSTFSLAQIVPSPMRTTGIISYVVPVAQSVSLMVYDVTGQLVRTLVDQRIEAGRHSVTWDGRDNNGKNVASGVYFYRLKGEEDNLTRKLIIVR
ncbi:MAG: T9SS type A sorting domain-containing protein [candidate division WOR-3 bacterium]|nr:MAG: T9SS type A sorting domain-containing protein [candidate division WOR-3 bacterium]